MLTAEQFLPAAAKFARQIVPPVVATLIAAVLIAAYNKTFSGHLSQPRFSGLQTEASAAPVAPPAAPVAAKPAAPVTEVITIDEYVDAPERLADKDAGTEAGKDQAAIKIAADPSPPRTATAERVAAPAPAARPEPRRIASVEHVQPVPAPVPVIAVQPTPAPVIAAHPLPAPATAAPPMPAPVIVVAPAAPPVVQEPPSVIAATPPIVTVPDRPNMRSVQAQAEPPAPPNGPIGLIVDTLKPSNWFARAREFGERIEQAGNDILPNIRQH